MASPGNADALQRHYGLQQTLAGSPRVHGNQTHLPRDGVWTAIASSKLDRRSVVFNNEVGAIVLGVPTPSCRSRLLRQDFAASAPTTLQAW